MVNSATNPWGQPNSATPQAASVLQSSAPAPTLTPSATTTTTSAGATTQEAMTLPVVATTGFAAGDIVTVAGSNTFVVTGVGPGNALVLRRYLGTVANGTAIASGAAVVKQTVS